MSWMRAEDGDIIAGWLLRLVVTLGALALVVFEIGAVVVASVTADDAAGEVARASADAYRASGSLARATEVAEEIAAAREVELTALDEDEGALVVEVTREAGTILLQRIPQASDLITRSATRRTEIGT
ncbi:MAG: hypothetical protein WD638_09985 [Nitriliruptoraceae bacterium]